MMRSSETSKTDLKQQKTLMFPNKESFQSIDDYYLQTEEDEVTQGYKSRSRVIQPNDMDQSKVKKPPPNLGGGINKHNGNPKLLFSKAKYVAKSIDHQAQNQSEVFQHDRNIQNERPNTPKYSKKMTFSLSTTQLRADFGITPQIKDQDQEKIAKSQPQQLLQQQQSQFPFMEFNSSKAQQPRSLLTVSSKNEPFSNALLMGDLQKRNTITNRTETNTKQSSTSLKENIFAKDQKQDGFIDIKTNQLFGQGPRYDIEGNIVQYTLVGRPEWYLSAQDDQKTYKRDSGSRQTRLNKKISMASYASKTSSVRIKNSIDTLSRIEKKKKTQHKIMGEQLSKEQLVRKLENMEIRVEENKKKEEKEKEKLQFFEKVNEEKQKHQLAQFDERNEKWEKLNQKISEKLFRIPENTLLKSSVPQFRQKVEITQILEQVKSPNEILGEKFWEVTLRDKFIDYMKIKSGQPEDTNSSQKHDSQFATHTKDGLTQDQRAQSSHQMNRSFYRELSYSKGTKVPVIFKKEVEVIKHPNLSTTTSHHGTLQYQTLGQFFGANNNLQINSSLANTMNTNPRPLFSQQMSRRPFSQQSGSNMSFRAKTPFNYTGFANANEFINSIQNSTGNNQTNNHNNNHNNNNQLNNSLFNKGALNNSFEKVTQFFTAITADPDEFVVKGENKLKSEKESLLHDGNHNQFIYKHFTQAEIQQLENVKTVKQDDTKPEDHQERGSESHKHSEKSHSGAIQKQSTFGSRKQLSVPEAQFLIRGDSSAQKKKGGNHSTFFQSNNNNEVQNNFSSISKQKSMKEHAQNPFSSSIKMSAFNQPFHYQ